MQPSVQRNTLRTRTLANQTKKNASAIACVLGIVENEHQAFNDPPADFAGPDEICAVTLADMARCQKKVGEGHFGSLGEVPTQALTLTIPALLKPLHVLAVGPEARKATAGKGALESPSHPIVPPPF